MFTQIKGVLAFFDKISPGTGSNIDSDVYFSNDGKTLRISNQIFPNQSVIDLSDKKFENVQDLYISEMLTDSDNSYHINEIKNISFLKKLTTLNILQTNIKFIDFFNNLSLRTIGLHSNPNLANIDIHNNLNLSILTFSNLLQNGELLSFIDQKNKHPE
jgi:hypothetical protein